MAELESEVVFMTRGGLKASVVMEASSSAAHTQMADVSAAAGFRTPSEGARAMSSVSASAVRLQNYRAHR